MVSGNVSVTTPGMLRACSAFEAASTSATSQLRSVNENQAALQASWRGDASNRFSQAMNDWEGQFQIIVKELNHMIEVMGGNAKTYAQSEEMAANIAAQWSMADGLPGL